jgi:hypothetical protein
MKNNRFQRWLQNVYKTQEEEISCSECFDQVAHFVEVELSGVDAVAQMPKVRHHLDQCPACRTEYEAIRDLQRLENEGKFPSVDDLKDLLD